MLPNNLKKKENIYKACQETNENEPAAYYFLAKCSEGMLK
jgi:hypothetical protein